MDHPITIAQRGFDVWKDKEHNAKWFRKIDGTPIPNDLVVCIAMEFVEALKEAREPAASFNELAAPYNSAGPILTTPPSAAISDDLAASIRTAESMLSAHIEEFHDFDYQPHEVPADLQQLRGIQHHLLGSLINESGEIYPYPGDATPTPTTAINSEDWQDISTAPHHTNILVWREDAGEPWIAEFTSLDRYMDDGDPDDVAWFSAYGRHEGEEAPTKWMPIPAGPSGERVIEQSEWPVGTLRQTVVRSDGSEYTRTRPFPRKERGVEAS